MIAPRVLALAAIALLAFPHPADAQVGGLIKRAKDQVSSARTAVADARAIRCEVQGVCGTVTQSELFSPSHYESLAVTVFDGTGRFAAEGVPGIVKDAFEARLVQNGFLLAASADADKVRERIAKGESGWTDEALKQLRDFVEGIDGVLVVEIRQLDIGQCQLGNRAGSEANVYLSVRWLNPDAGDIPWVARHSASLCRESSGSALSDALQMAAVQLATNLPVRTETEK